MKIHENISLNSILEVHQDDQLKNNEKSQDKHIRECAFQKTPTKKKGGECISLEKKNVSTKLSPSQKKFKFDSHGKDLKQNVDSLGHVKNSAKKKPDIAKEHKKALKHSLSDTKKDKNQTGKKLDKLSNHTSDKCDKTQTGKKQKKLYDHHSSCTKKDKIQMGEKHETSSTKTEKT